MSLRVENILYAALIKIENEQNVGDNLNELVLRFPEFVKNQDFIKHVIIPLAQLIKIDESDDKDPAKGLYTALTKIGISNILFKENPIGYLAYHLHAFFDINLCFTFFYAIEKLFLICAVTCLENDKMKPFAVNWLAPAMADLAIGKTERLQSLIKYCHSLLDQKEKITKIEENIKEALNLINKYLVPKIELLNTPMISFFDEEMAQTSIKQLPRDYNDIIKTIKVFLSLGNTNIEGAITTDMSFTENVMPLILIKENKIKHNLIRYLFNLNGFIKNTSLNHDKVTKGVGYLSRRSFINSHVSFLTNLVKAIDLLSNFYFGFFVPNFFEDADKEWRKLPGKVPFFTFLSNKLMELTQRKYLNQLQEALKNPEYREARKSLNRYRDILKERLNTVSGLFFPIFSAGDLLDIRDKPGRLLSFTHPKRNSKDVLYNFSTIVPAEQKSDHKSNETAAEDNEPESPAAKSSSAGSSVQVEAPKPSPKLTLEALKKTLHAILEPARKAWGGEHFKEFEIHLNSFLMALRRLSQEKDKFFPSVAMMLSHASIALEQLLKACYIAEFNKKTESERKQQAALKEKILASHDLGFILSQLSFADSFHSGEYLQLQGIGGAERDARYVELLPEFFPGSLSAAQRLLHTASYSPFQECEKTIADLLPAIAQLMVKIVNQGEDVESPDLEKEIHNYLQMLHESTPEKPEEVAGKPAHPELTASLEAIKKLLSQGSPDEGSEGFLNNFHCNLLVRASREAGAMPEREGMHAHFNLLFQELPWMVENLLCLVLSRKGNYDLEVIYNHDFTQALKQSDLLKLFDKSELEFLERIRFYRNLRFSQTQRNQFVNKIVRKLAELARKDAVGDLSDGFEMDKKAGMSIFAELQSQLAGEWKLLARIFEKLLH